MSSPADTEDFLQHVETLVIGASRGCPPTQVLAQMQRAAAVDGRLRAGGERLHFHSPMDGPLEIELHGPGEAAVRLLSAAQAIELSCPGAVA
jgi:hypothetical protein